MSKLLIMRVFTFILLMTPFFLNSQSFVDSVYEFNVGDEFHYTHQHRTNSGTNTTKTIKKIIGKTYTSGFVSYQILVESHTNKLIPIPLNMAVVYLYYSRNYHQT